MFKAVKSNDETESAASGYFLNNGVLVCKWKPCNDHVVGEPIFQIVIPEGLCDLVLKVAHSDIARHLGVKKTYNSIMLYLFLFYFIFWP